jgi:spore germination protein YaaH
MKTVKYILVSCLLFWGVFSAFSAVFANADLTAKYRVYQNGKLLKELVSKEQAIAYARGFANSYVEEISSRNWVWSYFPRYQVYQNGRLIANYIPTLEQAVAKAKYYSNASVRDLQTPGWVWHNWPDDPAFRLYQGENTLPNWGFADLDAAMKEAKKWAHSHIIDMRSKQWVWDNYTEQERSERKNGPKIYKVYVDGYSEEQWEFGFMGDAVKLAQEKDGAAVVNVSTNKVVYSKNLTYQVYQNDKKIKEFYNVKEAIRYATYYAHARIVKDGREIWNNYPYYQVVKDNETAGEFRSVGEAVNYAKTLPQALVRTYDGKVVWDNSARLLLWAWNGTHHAETIRTQVMRTSGLQADSPSWFALADAGGTLEDKSSAEMVQWLKSRGIAVHPLVHNQFDPELTSRFLSDTKAQEKFIAALVERSAALGVQGINVDFEGMKGSDRDKFTAFMQKLAAKAHQRGLTVSIDLPRGSAAWNHLTAYDHRKLKDIVDYIIIMAYDQHYSGSPEAGSVSGLPWTEQGVQEFLAYGIPRGKLILGIPFYVRVWQLDAGGKPIGNRSMTAENAEKLLETKQVKKTWDKEFRQYRVEYEEDGQTYVFWLEDSETLQARLELAKKYRLAGVAAWRLGYEPEHFWQTMAQKN